MPTLISEDSSLIEDSDDNSTLKDFRPYCNYPEISKSRHKLFVNLHDSCSISSDSSSTLPSLTSDLSEPLSGLDIWCKTYANASLHNFISSSSQQESLSKCDSEEEELDDISEESDTDTHASNNNYTILKNSTLKDVQKSLPINIDPEGWIKFALDTDPWSTTQYATNDSQISKSKSLTKEIVAAGACKIGQLPDTKAFALVRLHINRKGLEEVSILSDYRYFLYIDMSWNYISDITPLGNCDYLMYLNVSHNKLKEVLNMKPPWFLVYADLSCNEIKEIGDNLQNFWSLRYLDLSYNHISKVEGLNSLKYLEYLNLSHNYIEIIENLECPKLEELYIEYNKICTLNIESLSSLPHIKVLAMGHNKISQLSSFEHLQTVKKIDLNDNCVNDLSELSHLSHSFKLCFLNMKGNPVCHSAGYREFVIYKLKTLKTLDDTWITSSERVYAKILLQPDIFSSVQSLRTKVELWNQIATPRIDIETKPYDQSPVPILVLVGTFANQKEELADKLIQKYPNKICRLKKHTTLPSTNSDDQSNLISVSVEEFNSLIKGGELLFHYKEVGHFFGVHREELCKMIINNQIGVVETVLEAALVMRLIGLRSHTVLCVTDDDNAYANHLRRVFDKLELWSQCDPQVCESWTSDKSNVISQSLNSLGSVDSNLGSESLQESASISTEENSQKYGFNQCDPDFVWTWSIDTTVSTMESEPDAEYLNRMRGKEIFVYETLRQQNLYIEFNNLHPEMFKASVLTNNFKSALKTVQEVCFNLLEESTQSKTIISVKNNILNSELVKERLSFLLKGFFNKSS